MKCTACDILLTDVETVRKEKGEYLDLCHECYKSSKEALSELVDDSGFIYDYNLSGIET